MKEAAVEIKKYGGKLFVIYGNYYDMFKKVL
jgi:hypothetical protein